MDDAKCEVRDAFTFSWFKVHKDESMRLSTPTGGGYKSAYYPKLCYHQFNLHVQRYANVRNNNLAYLSVAAVAIVCCCVVLATHDGCFSEDLIKFLLSGVLRSTSVIGTENILDCQKCLPSRML